MYPTAGCLLSLDVTPITGLVEEPEAAMSKQPES
jgi:hypothetical protein